MAKRPSKKTNPVIKKRSNLDDPIPRNPETLARRAEARRLAQAAGLNYEPPRV
jgi:hypothetical protein